MVVERPSCDLDIPAVEMPEMAAQPTNETQRVHRVLLEVLTAHREGNAVSLQATGAYLFGMGDSFPT